jgi:hypothetical protein
MYKNRFIVITLLLLSSLFILSNTGSVSASSDSWIRTYGGANRERAETLIQCLDGGLAIVGTSNVSGTMQYWLLKTDSSGGIELNRFYGLGTSNWARHAIQTRDGGYAIAGDIDGRTAIAKIDEKGDVQWNRTYQKYASAWHIIQTSDNGYLLTGRILTTPVTGNFIYNPSYAVWAVKTDKSGVTLWTKNYTQVPAGSANAIIQTSDGGYAVCGATENADFLLIKTDSEGELQWYKTYGSHDKDAGFSILQSIDGGFVLAGLMWNRTLFGGVGLVRTDSEGNLQWLKNFPSSNTFSSMIRASDGNYILCSGMLNKIDEQGNLLWSKNVSFSGDLGQNYASPTALVVQTLDGGYVVAGTISNPQDMTSYVWMGKLDSNGDHTQFIPEFTPIAILIIVVTIFTITVAMKKRWLQTITNPLTK